MAIPFWCLCCVLILLKFFRRFKEIAADAGVEKAAAPIGQRVKNRHAWSMFVRRESQGACQWHRVSP